MGGDHNQSKKFIRSFKPNCITTVYDLEIAVRDIHPDEELLDEYGFINLEIPFVCITESIDDRDLVESADLQSYRQLWDRQLYEAFLHFKMVDQPLFDLINGDYLSKIKGVGRSNTMGFYTSLIAF